VKGVEAEIPDSPASEDGDSMEWSGVGAGSQLELYKPGKGGLVFGLGGGKTLGVVREDRGTAAESGGG